MWLYVTYPNGLFRSYEVDSRDELGVPQVCSVLVMGTWLELIATQGSDEAAKAALNLTEDVRDTIDGKYPHEL